MAKAVRSTVEWAGSVALGVVELVRRDVIMGSVGLLTGRTYEPGLIEYKTDSEYSMDEKPKEAGLFDLDQAITATRISCWGYLENARLYWMSDTRSEGYEVLDGKEQSVGLLLRTDRLPKVVPGVLDATLIDSSYDITSDDITIRNGVLFDKGFSTEVIIMHSTSRKTIYIAWQGTQSRRDVLTDVQILPAGWKYGNKGFHASRGVVMSHEAVIEPLLDTLKKLWTTGKYERIFLTGHSLGGALANLNAHALSYLMEKELSPLNVKERLVCYTVGAPKVCNIELRNDYLKRVPNSYRLVSDGDGVPRLPVPFRHHVGTMVYLDEERLLINPELSFLDKVSDSEAVSDLANDHDIGHYLALQLDHRHRFKSSADANEAVAEAFLKLIETTAESEQRENGNIGAKVVKPTRKAKSNPLYQEVEVPVEPVPLDSAVEAVLKKEFGAAMDEFATNNLLLYASKIIETHDFVPANRNQDIQNVDFDSFALAVWDLVQNPDTSERTNARQVCKARLVFDKIDDNFDGLCTAMQFANFTQKKAPVSSEAEATAEATAAMVEVYRELYAEAGQDFIADVVPKRMSFIEFFAWASLRSINFDEM